MRHTLASAVALVTLTLLAPPLFALPSADDLKASIESRATEMDKYRELLESDNQAMRLTALDALLAEDDLMLRQFAYRTAFESDDQTMRAVALKRRIGDMKTLVINVETGENPTEKEKKTLTAWGGIYAFEIESFDEKTGTFETTDYSYKGKGQVTGTTLSFAHQFCNGSFALGDGAVLTGTLGCRGKWEGRFTGNVPLN
jgi:hypothetical protein